MGSIPRFTLLPDPRCCEITSNSPRVICNLPARWMSANDGLGVTPFWCDEHKRTFAVPIAGVPIVRRVSVVAQVVLSSAVEADELARAEAVARLDRGIRAVGGLLNLHVVTCQTGPWAVPVGIGDESPNGGGR